MSTRRRGISKQLFESDLTWPEPLRRFYSDASLSVDTKGNVLVRYKEHWTDKVVCKSACHLVWNYFNPSNKIPKGKRVKFINGNKLDNTLSNLTWAGKVKENERGSNTNISYVRKTGS